MNLSFEKDFPILIYISALVILMLLGILYDAWHLLHLIIFPLVVVMVFMLLRLGVIGRD